MSDNFEIGGLYGYTGEVKDVISVAMSCRAKNGGWCGASIARMAMPGEHLTQEELNRFARLFIAAGNAATACEAAEYDGQKAVEMLPKVIEALGAISKQYENQNLTHVDFRVGAKRIADALLSSIRKPTGDGR